MDQLEISSLIKQSPQNRYEYFIKRIADDEAVWGLYDNGWALAGSSEGNTVFPLWPAMEYAALCSNGNWENYKPDRMSLKEFLDELLPELKKDSVDLGVFYTPEENGVVVTTEQIRFDLMAELEKY